MNIEQACGGHELCGESEAEDFKDRGTSGVNIPCNYIMQTVMLLLFSLWFYR